MVIPGHIADSTIVSCPATGVTVPADSGSIAPSSDLHCAPRPEPARR